jgi:hypothetical protein
MYEAISAMDDDEIVSVGRPYGGMAILWWKSLNCCMKVIECSKRIKELW